MINTFQTAPRRLFVDYLLITDTKLLQRFCAGNIKRNNFFFRYGSEEGGNGMKGKEGGATDDESEKENRKADAKSGRGGIAGEKFFNHVIEKKRYR